MEVHQLRYFLAVARHCHFSKAAAQCNVAQPSLSQQIRKLEEELGGRLFERTRRAVALTPAGRLFRTHAEKILECVAEAEEAMREASGREIGEVSLGVLPTIAPYLLPELLGSFVEKHPGAELVVEEDTTANLVEAVRTGRLDAALVSLPLEDRELLVEPLFVEELLALVPAGHPLARRGRKVRATDFDGLPFVLMQEGHCLGSQALSFCQARGLAPMVRFRSAQVETVKALVATGLGVSLVPEMARDKGGSYAVSYLPFAAPAPTREIVLASRAGHAGRALAKLRSHCREILSGR